MKIFLIGAVAGIVALYLIEQRAKNANRDTWGTSSGGDF